MKSVVRTATLVTEDGVPIDAVHLPGPRDLAIVMAHGFTQSWQLPRVWTIARRFNLTAGVVTFDFRGHGRSGGLSTLGDLEINDLDVAVAWARELGYQPRRCQRPSTQRTTMTDRKSTRLNSSHITRPRMPSSA